MRSRTWSQNIIFIFSDGDFFELCPSGRHLARIAGFNLHGRQASMPHHITFSADVKAEQSCFLLLVNGIVQLASRV